jgi:hypothetical protein
VFDPVSILFAVKSGLDPSAYTVLRPDPAYFKQERFGNCLGRIGAILFALGWFVAIPGTGVLAFFFPNPLDVMSVPRARQRWRGHARRSPTPEFR